MKKYTVVIALLFCHALTQAAPYVTTLVNTSPVTIDVELYFSDNHTVAKSIESTKLLPVINFAYKLLTKAVFSSSDKDKNGNVYDQLDQKFPIPKSDETYNLALQDVPSRTVDAGVGTEKFEMPATQKIVCNRVEDQKDTDVKK